MRVVLTCIVTAGFLLSAPGCPCSTEPPSEDVVSIDAAVPDVPAVQVNCADPSVWVTAPEVEGRFDLGGRGCEPPQYPLHMATLGARLGLESRLEVASSCWRVEEASANSGWEVGQTFGSPSPDARVRMRGFDPVTFTGRLFRADGSFAYAVTPTTVVLDEADFIEVTDPLVALLGENVWATQFAVYAFGHTAPTEDVVAATRGGLVTTLHRQGNEFSARIWQLAMGTLASVEVPLGAGEEALFAGGAVAIDDTLLLLGNDSISRRVSLPEVPLGLVARYHYVVVQLRDSLRVVYRNEEHETVVIPVTPSSSARLVSTDGDSQPFYYDGVNFARVVTRPSPRLAPLIDAPGGPSPEERGAPIFVHFRVHDHLAVMERGFYSLASNPPAGPRFASTMQLFGGGRILAAVANIGSDFTASYLVEFDDGRQRIYRTRPSHGCE